MPTYSGWTVITMPTDPAAPASIEFQINALVAETTNPFTGQQQVHDWNASYREISVSYPTMKKAQAQNWITFLNSLVGPLCVFQFSSAVCTAFPELTSDGSTPRYWRLKTTRNGWKLQNGPFYTFTFECREAT